MFKGQRVLRHIDSSRNGLIFEAESTQGIYLLQHANIKSRLRTCYL
jgi:hypothetical protein